MMKRKIPWPRANLSWVTSITVLGIAALIYLFWTGATASWTIVNWFFLYLTAGVFYAMLYGACSETANFWVAGETLNFDVELLPGQTLEIGPFTGLADKSLLINFESELPATLKYRRPQFTYYLGNLPPSIIFYRLQILNADDTDTVMIEKEVYESIYLAGRTNAEPFHPLWEPLLNGQFASCKLHIEIIDIDLHLERSVETPTLETLAGVPLLPLRLRGAVRAGLGLKTLRCANEVSIREATTRIIAR